jgi:hypothetical protein
MVLPEVQIPETPIPKVARMYRMDEQGNAAEIWIYHNREWGP